MSAINWGGTLPNLVRTRVEEEENGASGYRILRNERGFIGVLLQELLVATVNRVKKQDLVRRKEGQTSEYTVQLAQFYTRVVVGQRLLFKGKEPENIPEKKALSAVWVTYGLSFAEQRGALEKAVEIANQVLLTKTFVLKEEKDLDELETLSSKIVEAHLVANGAVVKDVSLPEPYDSLDIGPLNCVTFVFLYLDDEDFMREWQGQSESQELFAGGHVEGLKKLKYRPVSVPKAGDLVVYLHDQGGCTDFMLHQTIRPLPPHSPRLKHIGIYQRNGRVLSKNGGIYYPKIYEHNLDDVFGNYGNLIRFYRKIQLLG